jgi:hypothetical protein
MLEGTYRHICSCGNETRVPNATPLTTRSVPCDRAVYEYCDDRSSASDNDTALAMLHLGLCRGGIFVLPANGTLLTAVVCIEKTLRWGRTHATPC